MRLLPGFRAANQPRGNNHGVSSAIPSQISEPFFEENMDNAITRVSEIAKHMFAELSQQSHDFALVGQMDESAGEVQEHWEPRVITSSGSR